MGTVTSAKPRQEHDWYVEPSWCVELLIEAEPFAGTIYDPACGKGTIPEAFNMVGVPGVVAYGSDIVDRDARYFIGKKDFFDSHNDLYDNIVSNPPYKHAAAFVTHALEVTRSKVAIITNEKFLFSQARHELFTTTPLARIYFMSRRPSMPPGECFEDPAFKAGGGSIDYVWMVWHHGHKGPPSCEWLKG